MFIRVIVVFLIAVVPLRAQQQDVTISVTADAKHVFRLRLNAAERPFHEATHLRIVSKKSGADTIATPLSEVNGRHVYVEVVGTTPDSTGLVLTLADADARIDKKHPSPRWVVLRSVPVAEYTLDDVDRSIMIGLVDIVKGARMVHKGETKDPIADLVPIDLRQAPFDEDLSTRKYALAGISRLEPMWLASDEPSGARTILNYGYDADGMSIVQVVRAWYGPLRRMVYQPGAIVGVSSVGGEPPTFRVFDESKDSARYARVTAHSWQRPHNDTMIDGRYVVASMSILSSCVIPPKRWEAYPKAATLTRSVRLGFAPGYEGCVSARQSETSWPFGAALADSTHCHILASAKDANENTWYFVGLSVDGDPAMRRTFGDFSAGSEKVITGGWLPASALTIMGIPGVEGHR
ncbi:MAG: hypothetical protein FGM33_06735 [Candidatus Kapabacteria bacterium]|nr:hypothetical protein [Candidatus Kapabacteria bacterium]